MAYDTAFYAIMLINKINISVTCFYLACFNEKKNHVFTVLVSRAIDDSFCAFTYARDRAINTEASARLQL